MELHFAGFAKQSDILTDATPFAGASIATIAAKTNTLTLLAWDPKTNSPAYHVLQGTWAISAQPTFGGYALINNATQAINDELVFALYAPSTSALTLNIMYMKVGDAGIVTVLMDATSQGTIDTYSAAEVDNVITQITITPARIGLNWLHLKVASKNVGASAYRFYLQGMWI